MKVIIGIPAFNEEKNIGSIVAKLKMKYDHVIVCDDGSSDNTLNDGTAPWIIGASNSSSNLNPIYNNFHKGYVDEFRITASAVYTSKFTPAHHQFYPTQEHAITSNDNLP